mmetsp:Transcript_24249/g.52995  ORF Transcript_24249/g.52995 Transcript_24249/m.52995 type:complete len:524 (-) Transcript_24249:843-2414(-)
MQPATSLTQTLVKGYKKLLVKLHTAHFDDSSAVDVALQQPQVQAVLNRFEQARLRSDISFTRAFTKAYTALLEFNGTTILQASKQKAQEKLAKAWNSDYVRYIRTQSDSASSEASTSTATQQLPGAEVAELKPASGEVLEVLGQDGMLRRAVVYVLAHASRGFMQGLNNTEVEGMDIMERALQRPAGQPLITVCNHVAAMDDPLVMSSIIPPKFYEQPQSLRWTLCATDRCFKYGALVPFFRAAKVLPVKRGGGMTQAGMQAAEDRLQHGDWVHIFPEGTRSRDAKGRMGQIRKGVGRLVASCAQAPLVVPFVHTGMEDVMPRGKVLPAVGKTVRVLVGEPIPTEDLLAAARMHKWSDDQLYSAIAERVAKRMVSLKARLDGVAEPEAATDQQLVSQLDLYDEADLKWERRTTVWEKLKFKMQHREWQRMTVMQQRIEEYTAAKVQRLNQGVEAMQRILLGDMGLLQGAAAQQEPVATAAAGAAAAGGVLAREALPRSASSHEVLRSFSSTRRDTILGLLQSA